jgi:hypothetical protein
MHACKFTISKLERKGKERKGRERESKTNLILKIAHIDRLLYSPAQFEVFVLHQQELFLKRIKTKGLISIITADKSLNIFWNYKINSAKILQTGMKQTVLHFIIHENFLYCKLENISNA